MCLDNVAFVVIGRNEGERLTASLNSIKLKSRKIVYVDSGSTDNSIATAEQFGVFVVRLDLAQPFTAARARNEGFTAVKKHWPHVRYIQFMDGDCVLVCDWLDHAVNHITQCRDVAIVCGRRRERYPDRSIYNWLCDLEWNTPIGDTANCGGDSLVDIAAFEEVGGFLSELTAGEEPDLCQRLRQAGWKVCRIDAEMTKHDAAMTHFRQWWRRTVRGGFAAAQMCWLRIRLGVFVGEQNAVVSVTRSITWAGLYPLAIGIGAYFHPVALAGVLLYVARIVRIAASKDISSPNSWKYGFLMSVLAFAQFQGNLRFCWYYLSDQPMKVVEYKGVSTAGKTDT